MPRTPSPTTRSGSELVVGEPTLGGAVTSPRPSPHPRVEATPIFTALCRDRGFTLPDPPPVPEPRGRHQWRPPWPVTADPDPPTIELPAQREG